MTASLLTPPSLPSYDALDTQERKLCLRVRQFLSRDLALDLHGGNVLLAVSGGADSLALLCIMLLLRPVLGHSVVVAHVDHGLRPESAAEARHVEALAAAWELPFHSFCADVRTFAAEQKMGLEEAARHLRYTLLDKARKRSAAHWLCAGHHAGDLREDILMRLARGAGWPALGGMQAKDDGRRILRPLLLEEPEVLRQLLCRVGLVWMEDGSNADTAYTRNRVRHELLPALLAENPSFPDAARQLWRMAHDDADFWEKRLAAACNEHKARFEALEVHLPATLLRSLHRAERLRLYVRGLRHLVRQGGKGQARAATLYQLDEALVQGRGGTVFQLPGGVNALVRRGGVTFQWG